MKTTIAILLLLFISTAAEAQTYYVKKTGSNSHSCKQIQDQSTPALTISYARSCVGTGATDGAGKTIRVFKGVYVERLVGNWPGGSSETNRFILESNPGDEVILRPASGTGHAIEISDRSYITIRSGNVTMPGVSGPRFIVDSINLGSPNDGIKISGASSFIRLQDLEVKNATIQGIQLTSGTSKNHLLRVWSHNNGSTDNHDHGLYMKGPDNIVEYSLFENNWSRGIQNRNSSKTAHRNIIRNNILRNNGRDGNSTNLVVTSGDDVVVYNNIISGATRGGIGLTCSGGCPNRTKIFNNTIWKNGQNAIRFASGSTAQDTEIRNNIFWENGSDSVNGAPSGTITSNNLTTNPQFVDSAKFDLRLKSASPAVDKGKTLAVVTNDFAGILRPQGSGYDIGAYEYVPITSTPPTSPTNLQTVVQ